MRPVAKQGEFPELGWPAPARLRCVFTLLVTCLANVGTTHAQSAKTLRAAQTINQRLSLRQSDVVQLGLFSSATASGDAGLSVEFPIEGMPVAVTLTPHSNRSDEYQLIAQVAGGGMVEFEPGPVNTYRGSIDGIDGSAVAATLDADGLFAMLLLPDGSKFWLEPLAAQVAGASPDQYVLYRDEDLLRGGEGCKELHPPADGGQNGTSVVAGGEGTVAGGLFIAELAADADVEYFQDYGSIAAVEAQINSIINTVNVQYERDLSIRHVVNKIIVRTAEPDPYSQTDAAALLQQVKNHWDSQQFTVNRDLTQLFTGKQLNDTTIGVAWVGGTTSNTVCGSYGYSVVESNCLFSCSSFAAKTDLSAHELGHNWGADHCACPGWTMNPTITSANRFHPVYDIPEMTTFRDSRPCLNNNDELRRLIVTAAGPAVNEGGYLQLTATADFRYGEDENVTAFTTWSLDNTLGKVATNGLYHAYYVDGDVCLTVTGSFTYGTTTKSGQVTLRIIDPDAPLRIITSDPPNGAIDARQPSDPAATIGLGWDTVQISLNGEVCGAVPTDFTVVEENGAPPAPTVIDVVQISPSSYQLVLSDILEPGAWTTVTHVPSASSTRIGFLPGDVNGNRVSNAADVTALISDLDGANASEWSTDIDWSGQLTAADLIALVDLLNGAQAFIDWDGFTLP